MAKNKTSNDLTLDNFRRVFREEIKEELKPINARLSGVEGQLKPINSRLAGLKEEIRDVVKEELRPINFKLGTLGEKVDGMDQKFEKKFDEGMTKVDGLLGIGKNHIEEHAANQTAHDRFEEKFTQVFAHLSP